MTGHTAVSGKLSHLAYGNPTCTVGCCTPRGTSDRGISLCILAFHTVWSTKGNHDLRKASCKRWNTSACHNPLHILLCLILPRNVSGTSVLRRQACTPTRKDLEHNSKCTKAYNSCSAHPALEECYTARSLASASHARAHAYARAYAHAHDHDHDQVCAQAYAHAHAHAHDDHDHASPRRALAYVHASSRRALAYAYASPRRAHAYAHASSRRALAHASSPFRTASSYVHAWA